MNEKIKVYTMKDCPDCIEAKERLSSDPDYVFLDIGSSVRILKEFLRLRDKNEGFQKIKESGAIGIPCFVYPDGRISFEVPYKDKKEKEKSFCRLDGKGC